MKTIRQLLMLPSLLLAFYSCGNAQDWRKIRPLESNRSEVEALLGPAQGPFSAIYQLKEGSLFIEYSSGPCTPERQGGWNVPKNVVVSLSFSPRHKKRFANVKIDPRKFRKETDQHVMGIIYYVNDEDGITYELQDGKIDSIEYGPPRKHNNLYCGDPPRKNEGNTNDDHNIFEKYDGSTNVKERRQRLDALANYLNENRHFQAYIMSYGRRRSCVGEAVIRGENAKSYLVKSKGIKSRRVTVIDAGYREHWVIELWYGVAGASRPTPLETIDREQVILKFCRP